MAITLEWLEENASDTSFERGEYIALSQNIKVTKKGNTYSAKVRGTYKYEVEITDSGYEPEAECSCPYDWGGICKHIVAVGLTIIEEFEEEEEDEIYAPIIKSSTSSSKNVADFLEKTFLKADKNVQKEFLLQLFTQNPTFIGQFEAFSKPITTTSPTKTTTTPTPEKADTLDSIAKKVCGVFSKIDMEKVQRKSGYHYDDYYDDESGETPEWATKKLEELFAPYYKKGKELLEKGDLRAFFTFLIGVYEGLLNAEEPIFDDYDLFENYNTALAEIFSEHLDNYIPIAEKMVINEVNALACVSLVFRRAEYHYKDKDAIDFDLRDWQDFLMAFINSQDLASQLLEMIYANFGIYERVPYLQMKLAALTGNKGEWANIGETYLWNDEKTVAEILDYYKEGNNNAAIVRFINAILVKTPSPNTTLLLKYLHTDIDKDLHFKLLEKTVLAKRSIDWYRKCAELASPAQKESLINAIKPGFDTLFYMTVLAEENRHAEIIPLMGKASDSEIPKMLRLLLDNQVEASWSWTKQLVLVRLESTKRDRSLYSMLAKAMAVFLDAPAYKIRALDFALAVMNQYSRLKALREEMKSAKLFPR
jgi:hypothetical protein